MDNNQIKMYEKNKNIFLEDVAKQSFFQKVIRQISWSLIQHFQKKEVKPVFSERVVEYPLLFNHLELKKGQHILDFGCVEDILPIHLCSLGYKVTGLDFRAYPFSHENFKFLQSDILTWDPPIETFDVVISISTIEHVGLSAYGDPVCENGDKIAVNKLWHSLKTGSDLIVTLPAGKRCTKRGMRIYDLESIKKLIPNIKVIKLFSKAERCGDWKETTPETISTLVYENYYTTSPA